MHEVVAFASNKGGNIDHFFEKCLRPLMSRRASAWSHRIFSDFRRFLCNPERNETTTAIFMEIIEFNISECALQVLHCAFGVSVNTLEVNKILLIIDRLILNNSLRFPRHQSRRLNWLYLRSARQVVLILDTSWPKTPSTI